MSYLTSVCKLEMWLICKGAHCFEISIHKILFFFQLSLQNSTFRHKHTQD